VGSGGFSPFYRSEKSSGEAQTAPSDNSSTRTPKACLSSSFAGFDSRCCYRWAAEKPSDISTEEWNRLVKEKREQEMELANLSTNRKVIIAEKSGHHIQLDEPQLVVDAIRRVIESVRGRTLPPAQTSITPEATIRSFYK
jgi:hypothetical protein